MSNMRKATARVEWIKNQLRAGSPWNATSLAAEFGVSPKTAQRTIDSFREVYPDWNFKYDARERTYCLDGYVRIPGPDRIPDHLEMTLAEFATIRKRLSLTQDQLAKCLDIRQESVSRWELGKTRIPVAAVLLMRALDRTLAFGHWLGGGSER